MDGLGEHGLGVPFHNRARDTSMKRSRPVASSKGPIDGGSVWRCDVEPEPAPKRCRACGAPSTCGVGVILAGDVPPWGHDAPRN